jgi:hypothetical protein
MFRFLIIIAGLSISLFNLANAEMKALDDEVLSGVSGQSGITLDVGSKFELGELAYFG